MLEGALFEVLNLCQFMTRSIQRLEEKIDNFHSESSRMWGSHRNFPFSEEVPWQRMPYRVPTAGSSSFGLSRLSFANGPSLVPQVANETARIPTAPARRGKPRLPRSNYSTLSGLVASAQLKKPASVRSTRGKMRGRGGGRGKGRQPTRAAANRAPTFAAPPSEAGDTHVPVTMVPPVELSSTASAGDEKLVEGERVEAGGGIEEASAGREGDEVEGTSGDARPAYPSIWKAEQHEEFTRKNEWLYAHDGKLGCTSCRDVKNLGVKASRGVNIAIQWADGKIAPYGSSRETQLTSLRKKIHEHGNSKAHNEVTKILETAKKDALINMNTRSQAATFESTAKVFRTAYYVAENGKPFTDFESLVDLQVANSVDLGRVLHSKTICVDIIEHISSRMKRELLKKMIGNKSKITVMADESTSVGHKSTLIVFLRASVDGKMEPIAFPLDLVELDSLSAAHIKDQLMGCLLKNGFTIELLREVLIGFCSDGASVMLGAKSGVVKLLQDDFPGIVLWHCLNHRLELAADQALDVTGGTKDFQAFLDSLYSLYSQSLKNVRELSECAHNLHITLKRIGKVFSVRWVASSYRAVSAVWQSFPALAQHFREASEDEARDGRERAKFRGLLSKLTSINFLKNLAVMADVLSELKDLSEMLQNRKITLPKAHNTMTMYVKRIESLSTYPGKCTVAANQAEEAMEFKGEKLNVGESPIINSGQFIRAVSDNMKERLFTTTANGAQASVTVSRKETYDTLMSQMAVLDPDNWDHDNPRFGEEEVKALSQVLHVNETEAHLGFVEYKTSGGRSIPNQMKRLLMAVDTLSPSNADCERGFISMNMIITQHRSKLTAKNASDLLFISCVGPPCRQWDPLPYVKTWLDKGRKAATSTKGIARHYSEEEDNYYSPLWKVWKSA
ncbi:hypothetical protein GJAV_G00206160 [Gymnothorax javanicus]|nr:hypothetical protein GJAV_G00206160 [Gymnothorax javanicus]